MFIKAFFQVQQDSDVLGVILVEVYAERSLEPCQTF